MFSTILVASDGTETADLLVTVAQSLAGRSATKVVVAHVKELMAGRGGAQTVHPNEDLLQRKVRLQVADLQAAGVDAELHMQTTIGTAAKSIAGMARECHADLIVAGASRHGPIADLVFGTTGQRMIRLAPCPVLVVPPSQPTHAAAGLPHVPRPFVVVGSDESRDAEHGGDHPRRP
jgi:nucleotide-binding universal stress UspA family protein